MFAKLSTLLLALPLVSALSVGPITDWSTASTVTLTWTATTTDPAYFSIELVNTDFHNTYAIANNVQTSLGTITMQLPEVPVEGGYTVQFIATNNVNSVLAQSGTFSIGSPSSSSTTGTSTGSSTSTSATTASSATSSGTVSIPSATATTPSSSASIGSASGSASAASASPSSFNTGSAASFKVAGIAPAAALVLSAVAGAVMVF